MSEKDVHKLFVEYLFSIFDDSVGGLFDKPTGKLEEQNITALFNTDMSGIRLPQGLAAQASKLRSHSGFPDVTLYIRKANYVGFMLELKAPHIKIYKKNGELRKCEHLEQQAKVHKMLTDQGWFVDFACGIDEAKEILDLYLSLPNYEPGK